MLKVDVFCLNVVGDNATIGGAVAESNDLTNYPVGGTVTAFVSDNTAAEDPNIRDAYFFTQRSEPLCPEPLDLEGFDETGDLVVHDAR
jgi:hypothetical protein